MSSTLRSLTRHSRALSQRTKPTAALPVRFFHSPFVALNSTSNSSPLTKPPSESSAASPHYEKQHDHSPDPQISQSGTQTYVVSEPDPAHTPYEVPSGAFPTSAPYVNFTPTERLEHAPTSSTGSEPAHPYTTRAVPRNESGVGQSAAVRHRQAPGEMGQKGGSFGGLDVMSKQGAEEGDAELAERNLQPDAHEVTGKFSKLGVDEAWKHRK
ncbi:hypothetical protein PILCRDRAFT_68144 [Piloderma croceum F 1598]|uniref:Uncharacterized protein n=1 Tax=Piloderma croceum (strain F 1598) TaxID=765440 RepID=A0A0C3G0U8_PILCF|nr:hypothetical protein PILCRDRAFT_68144 [Piloderma croceum F 1598]